MSNVLEEAASLVYNGDRQHEYGHPKINFARIAAMWNGYLQAKLAAGVVLPITQEDTAYMMMLVKMARLMQTPNHRDSFVDMAGYAATAARVAGVDD